MGILEAPPVSRTQGKELVDSALGMAATLAVKAAAAAIKWEADKYVKESTGELKEAKLGNLSSRAGDEGWVLSNHGSGLGVPSAYITVIRYVTPKRELGFWESVWRTFFWFERPTHLEPVTENFVDELVQRVKTYNQSLMARREDATIKAAFGLGTIPQNSFLGFAAVLQITPAAPLAGKTDGYPNYRIELLDYRYSALKAKNLSWIRVPFNDWEKTKSALEVTLRGPRADMRLDGNQYEAKVDFELTWNRELSGDKLASEWANKNAHELEKPLGQSPPIHTYDFRNFGVSIKLSEACTIKEALENASKKVADIDVEDLLKQ
ncbi:MAG: hypothetical protein H8K05_00275 [Nitrospira sp.]|nr:hypothetical protein [Nitrospira sp.]